MNEFSNVFRALLHPHIARKQTLHAKLAKMARRLRRGKRTARRWRRFKKVYMAQLRAFLIIMRAVNAASKQDMEAVRILNAERGVL